MHSCFSLEPRFSHSATSVKVSLHVCSTLRYDPLFSLSIETDGLAKVELPCSVDQDGYWDMLAV